jgi:hypothetical protein
MSLTFLELKNESRQLLWPDLEAENLVDAHDRFFNDALWDISKNVECAQFGNLNLYPQCSSYFNCGMTVLPAPRGRILKVYTIKGGSTTTPTPSASAPVGNPIIVTAGQVMGEQQFTVPFGKWSPGGGPPLLQGDPVAVNVCSVPLDGQYIVTVSQASPYWNVYAPNSPQYMVTQVNYTDVSGNPQTIQPAPNIFPNTPSNTGSLTISVKGGTTISAVATPVCVPPTDGEINVDVKVVANANISAPPKTPATPTNGSVISVSADWCSKVFYDQVEYCHIEEYVKLSRHCATPNSIFAGALIFNLFGFGHWRNKRRYPCPTDAGLESLPSLPQGFHYPQASTDAGGRSRGGVWALYRGRIYIAPWIESDETVVVEWNGIKDQWSDNDLVEDDSKFRQAVRLNVAVQHFTHYEQDQQKLVILETQWREALRDLIHECREQNRIRSCSEAGGSGSEARGIGTADIATSLYQNEAQSYTASCPVGQTGTAVTVTIPAGQVGSALSVADANATALAQAVADATSRLSCSVAPTIFYNVAVYGHASCPGASGDTPAASGNEVTVAIAAGLYSSSLPNGQDVANAAAQAEADRRANLQLVCTFHNSPQSAKGSCPSGTAGSDQTATVLASDPDCDATSQAAADALAQTKAANLLAAQLLTVCIGLPTYLIGNEAKTYTITRTLSCQKSGYFSTGYPTFNCTSNIPANWKTALVTSDTELAVRSSLNQQAQTAAQTDCDNQFNFAQAQYNAGCRATGGDLPIPGDQGPYAG